jgi:hypothetical protein
MRLGRHAAAIRFSARNEGQIRGQMGHCRDGRTDGGMGYFRDVGPLRATLHIWKLIPQRGDTPLG